MFKVDLEVDDKINTYYVWGKGELIETLTLGLNGYLAINDTQHLDVSINVLNDKVNFIVRHLCPVMISKDDHDEYMKNLEDCNCDNYFLPVTEIDEEDYDLLYEVYRYQDDYKEETLRDLNISDALETAKKYVKQK